MCRPRPTLQGQLPERERERERERQLLNEPAFHTYKEGLLYEMDRRAGRAFFFYSAARDFMILMPCGATIFQDMETLEAVWLTRFILLLLLDCM